MNSRIFFILLITNLLLNCSAPPSQPEQKPEHETRQITHREAEQPFELSPLPDFKLKPGYKSSSVIDINVVRTQEGLKRLVGNIPPHSQPINFKQNVLLALVIDSVVAALPDYKPFYGNLHIDSCLRSDHYMRIKFSLSNRAPNYTGFIPESPQKQLFLYAIPRKPALEVISVMSSTGGGGRTLDVDYTEEY